MGQMQSLGYDQSGAEHGGASNEHYMNLEGRARSFHVSDMGWKDKGR